jgi:tryptophan synthase alpha chain
MLKRSPVMSPRDRIRAAFERLRNVRRKALIPFLMGGDPDLVTSKALILAVAEAGADLIEVGIPFSDPLADGPTIQRASARSLKRGTTPTAVLEMVTSVSRRIDAPVVLLSYWNPILQYGNGRLRANDPSPFVRQASRCGACGIIVPDLPLEEAAGFQRAATRVGVAPVFLAAPTSPSARLRQIARASEGFIYYVSLTGTTGVRDQLSADWLQGVRQLKLLTTKPVCVGFGISTPSQAAVVARVADGVIVGSALIRAIEPFLRQKAMVVKRAASFIRAFRRAV